MGEQVLEYLLTLNHRKGGEKTVFKKNKYEPKRLKKEEYQLAELRKKKSSGLFSKFMVIYCLAFVSIAAIYTFWLIGTKGIDANATLTVVCGLFGTELLLLCMKRIFQKSDRRDAQIETLINKIVNDSNGNGNGNSNGSNNGNSTNDSGNSTVNNNTFNTTNYGSEFDSSNGSNFNKFVNNYKYQTSTNQKAKVVSGFDTVKKNMEDFIGKGSKIESNLGFEVSADIDSEINDIFGSGGLVISNPNTRDIKEVGSNNSGNTGGVDTSADWSEDDLRSDDD